MKDLNRRKLIQTGTLGVGSVIAGTAFGQTCALTPAQTEGPFYPVQAQDDTDWDLTVLQGREQTARGTQVLVLGQVFNSDCEPVAGALVEIWQACESGKYNHPSDPNPAELDPDFQYWGRVLTDDAGRYRFKTIIPGAYPASSTWDRPPHIHFKVSSRGRRQFTTQMYFKGHPLNDSDLILKSLTPTQRSAVIVDFNTGEGGLRIGKFDIFLNIAGNDQLTPELD